jgi:lysophospholipase L1-like esterase
MWRQNPDASARGHIYKLVLGFSLLANLVAGAAGFYVLDLKGGAGYLRWRLSKWRSIDASYVQRESLFAVLDEKADHPLVFLGDSLTVSGEWGELLGTPIANRGIPGETTALLLARIDRVAALRPRAVFLMIGVNDNTRHVAAGATLRNYRQIVQRIRAVSPETVIYIQSILPTSFRGDTFNAWSMSVNSGLRELCDGSQIMYLDLYRQFLAGSELNLEYSVDGLHLNGKGYELWRKNVASFVAMHASPVRK